MLVRSVPTAKMSTRLYSPSLVMNDINSLTHSCMHSFASLAIFAFSGKASFMMRATRGRMLACPAEDLTSRRRNEGLWWGNSQGWVGCKALLQGRRLNILKRMRNMRSIAQGQRRIVAMGWGCVSKRNCSMEEKRVAQVLAARITARGAQIRRTGDAARKRN